MSVAFASEEGAEAASETILPARPISDRINLVTEAGLKMLQDELARARQVFEAAKILVVKSTLPYHVLGANRLSLDAIAKVLG